MELGGVAERRYRGIDVDVGQHGGSQEEQSPGLAVKVAGRVRGGDGGTECRDGLIGPVRPPEGAPKVAECMAFDAPVGSYLPDVRCGAECRDRRLTIAGRRERLPKGDLCLRLGILITASVVSRHRLTQRRSRVTGPAGVEQDRAQVLKRQAQAVRVLGVPQQGNGILRD